MNRMTTRVRALGLVASHLGTTLTDLRAAGRRLAYRGVLGGDHVISDHRGRTYQVDLVLETVSLCVGVPPRPEPW